MKVLEGSFQKKTKNKKNKKTIGSTGLSMKAASEQSRTFLMGGNF